MCSSDLRGQGLLCGTATGSDRAAFTAIASGHEHQLATTDPAELATLRDTARTAESRETDPL